VFSPDNDGVNDFLTAFGLDLVNLEIEIFNRWGQMVYKSNLNEMAWDGKFLDIDLPNATYVYRIFDINGSVRQTGTVSIVR
jgi:gliding motility-associated-like protein